MTDSKRWGDIYRGVIEEVRRDGEAAEKQFKGDIHEILGHKFVIPNGRDRILYQHPRFDLLVGVGHWLWIMAGRMDFESIRYYNPGAEKFSADRFKMHGAYGPRLFGIGVFDQVNRQIEHISERGDTKRAVATVYAPEFDTFRKVVGKVEDEVPCTIALQFRPRDGKLHMITMMRSQNAFGLLPLDVFVFTLIQEYVARAVVREVASYTHFSSSFHYYDRDVDSMVKYVATLPEHAPLMPEMPYGPQQEALTKVLVLEEAIRNDALRSVGKKKFIATRYLDDAAELAPFWQTIVHILIAMAASHVKDEELLERLLKEAHPAVRPAYRRRLQMLNKQIDIENYDITASDVSA